MTHIDTNIIIRYLTKDDLEKAKRAYSLFQRVAHGEEEIAITEAVITEVVYVLSSKRLYNLSRETIVKSFLPLLLLKGVHLGCKPGDKTLYTQALHLYGSTTLDITDVIILAKLQHEDTAVVYSFDTDFDDFEGVTRKEPDAIEKEAA